MDENKNCSACNIKLDKKNYKKDRTICENRYIEKRRKNKNYKTLIQNQQPKNDNVNAINNHRTFLVGPSFSVKSFLMLKILSRKPSDRDINIMTKSPLEDYSNSKIKIEERREKIKPLSENENAIQFSEDILGSSKSRYIYQFSIRGRHNNLDIYYVSQSYFDLPKKTTRNNSTKIFLLIKR